MPELVEPIEEDTLLLVGQMERFGGVIRKERVSLDFTAQRRPRNQVGMEQEALRRRDDTLVKAHLGHLARSETGDGPLLIVIGLLAISDVATLRILQKQRVDAVIHRKVSGTTRGLPQIDHGNQGVTGLETEHPVIGFDRIKLNQIFHKAVINNCANGANLKKIHEKIPGTTHAIHYTRTKRHRQSENLYGRTCRIYGERANFADVCGRHHLYFSLRYSPLPCFPAKLRDKSHYPVRHPP